MSIIIRSSVCLAFFGRTDSLRESFRHERAGPARHRQRHFIEVFDEAAIGAATVPIAGEAVDVPALSREASGETSWTLRKGFRRRLTCVLAVVHGTSFSLSPLV